MASLQYKNVKMALNQSEKKLFIEDKDIHKNIRKKASNFKITIIVAWFSKLNNYSKTLKKSVQEFRK